MSTPCDSLASCHKLMHNIFHVLGLVGCILEVGEFVGGIKEPSKQLVYLMVTLCEGIGSGRSLKVQLFGKFSLVSKDVGQHFLERQKKFDACLYNYH